MFQVPTSSNLGEKQDDIRLTVATKNHQLPDTFTTVPAVSLNAAKVSVPQVSNASVPKEGQLDSAKLGKKKWLQHASRLLEKDKVENGDTIAWSAFHASMQNPADLHTTLTQLLPLFYVSSYVRLNMK